ncbi:unnamed protein product [Symbiodinium sp. CCMP2592]|nr:unnamed protein product [Symbiodinium sp. CCMP2592]
MPGTSSPLPAPSAEGGGIFNLAQTQFTPILIRNILCQTPLSCQPILGNGSTLQISCDCWSKGQSDTRYPLIANFNSLGQRVTDLENSPGVDPATDLAVNSLTATSFVDTPLLQSAAADLQIRNATTTIRAEDGTLVASFAAGNIGLEQDVTAPLVRSDPAAPWLTVQGGTNGILMDDTVRINGVLGPEASLPFLSLSGGSSGVQVLSPLLEQIAVGPTDGTVGMVIRNAAPTGDAHLLLDANGQNGLAVLKAQAGGGVQLNTLFQFMSFNTTNGLANLAIEPNIGGSNDGEVRISEWTAGRWDLSITWRQGANKQEAPPALCPAPCRLEESSADNVVRLLELWSPEWKHRGRQRAIGSGSYELYCTLGLFAYGGNDPMLSKASVNRDACVALNHFLRYRFPDATWTSIAVVLNPRIGLHRDILNMIGKPNHAIALGSFTGGRIWVEDDDGAAPELRVTKRNTQQLWGSWTDMHDKPVSFNARRYHKVEPHEGRMWAIAAYTPQAFARCSQENCDAATCLGFPTGKSEGTKARQVAGKSSHTK